MSTIISRRVVGYTSEDRSWLAAEHGSDDGATPGITLDPALFPAGDDIKSGTAVSKTANGLYGPFDAAADEHGLLFSSVRADRGVVGGAVLVHGFVDYTRLPATGRPAIAALRAALPLIHFTA